MGPTLIWMEATTTNIADLQRFRFRSCSHQQPIQDFNNLTSPLLLLLLLRFKVQPKSCQDCQGAGVVLFTLG